jgi:hypothetical protein
VSRWGRDVRLVQRLMNWIPLLVNSEGTSRISWIWSDMMADGELVELTEFWLQRSGRG